MKHYIDAGVAPHTPMRWSGHRTDSMLQRQRHHIIDLDDLRRAGTQASNYREPKDKVINGDFGTGTARAQTADSNGPAPSLATRS